MKENIDLLNYIYEISKLQQIKILSIKDIIQDEKILKMITEYEKEYFEICNISTDILLDMKQERKDISNITKTINHTDDRISTMNDNSSHNIASLITKDNNKNILDIQSKLSKYKGKNRKIISLLNKLSRLENKVLSNLKKYL